MPLSNLTLISVFLVGASVGSLRAELVDFEAEVAPFLEAKCLSCHNPNLMKGDISMATRADLLAAGDDVLIPGNAEESMMHWITLPYGTDGTVDMPEEGEPLTEAEAAALAGWIEQGAEWPEGLVLKEASKADKSWWAYQPIEQPELDSVDGLIEARLQENGLTMNGEADRRVLIRRATYDLWGLAPSPEEVEAFVDDPDPQAYERLVERLLASPRYGERWGRHWLDVVRFGESVGFEQNWLIKDLWPFRDYVIQSFNEDKPFDQLIREHLAGDEIGEDDPEKAIGTAFLVAGPHDTVGNQDAAQAAQIRANTLDEMINVSGEAFLGLTVSCARCHDHKFDPISQADYYRMYATFSGVRHGSVTWASEEAKRERAGALKPLKREETALKDSIDALREEVVQQAKARIEEFETEWTRPPVERTGLEESFEPVVAKFVRLVCESQDLDPRRNDVFFVDEFEVWSDGPESVNVALDANGGVASGPARVNEDFPGSYGPQHANDGEFDERFVSTSDHLIIELAEPTSIDRVFVSSAREEEAPDLFAFAFVADYRIEVSMDGSEWREVAHGRDRKPVEQKPLNPANNSTNDNPTHLEHRLFELGIADAQRSQLAELHGALAQTRRAISQVESLPTAWIGERSEEEAKGPFFTFIGGSPQRPGEPVKPGSLSTLSEVMPGYELEGDSPEGERRRQFAEWVTHDDNPLTLRVLANRIWFYHFGAGIVNTPNDFGYMGEPPSHPELLDFLALELEANDWRLKPMHRMIMLSKTYRQSSNWRETAAKVDADSRLLWRFPPRRLSAEEIRDTMLQVAGELKLEMGGPGFRLYIFLRDNTSTYEPRQEHGPETYRRAVYHQNARASVVDLMTDFDQADCTLSTPKRSQTTTPLQALTLMNHSFTLDMAQALEERVEERVGSNLGAQVDEVFRLAYQRPPDREERKRSIALSRQHGLGALGRAIFNSSELMYLD